MASTSAYRGDEDTLIRVGDYSNIQDGVILHALETTINGTNIEDKRFSAEGDRSNRTDLRFMEGHAIYIDNYTSLARIH